MQGDSVPLDPSRVQDALQRCVEAEEEARFHEGQARAARARIATLAKTWSIRPEAIREALPCVECGALPRHRCQLVGSGECPSGAVTPEQR